jgi:hypothetical protein
VTLASISPSIKYECGLSEYPLSKMFRTKIVWDSRYLHMRNEISGGWDPSHFLHVDLAYLA